MVALSISRQAEYPPTGKPAKTGSRSSRADAVGPDAASASHRQELEANMSRDNAIVMRYDNPDIPSGRDIVYLHGRGSTEREAGFALPLFGRANVRSYRGPLPQGPGFAWFENAGIGVALPSSLSGETSKVGDWIAADTGRQRPWLCGFSNGAAMAASLLLSNPGAYSGLIMIGGCFAVEDGDLPDNGLLDKPVLFCRGQFDDVIPRHKFEQAEAYLSGPSGARATFIPYEGGHELPLPIKAAVQGWLGAESR
ncbi:esterase [Sphingomonas sp. BHC-A]|uniref:Esterase n=10 Tax=Sphingomonadaceae TaxID=41297 RepID=A0A2S8B031_9SPHN|nr:putative esterase [Sphingomonas sp. MM-1]AMK20339.1 putative esterase [Sphingobium sp. MI1205]AMK26712.1 putative esterase [Sphingobium sp. TKS]APL95040.1 esterase [Sphingobium indicum B90A]EPR12416.1 esterase [Sphingobium indicum IP26]EQB00509.1 esterase [Sphingobium baderi LL03]EQB02872.1 esterase [Sphingobium sp. HDIP04]EQB07836.1 esterase [Sphingobium quisquiliarum P25]EQB33732.1 esterase [Sphingobium ummariense RL-3]KER34920.1 esterase [Sphingobium indicum F2]KEY99746.1 esterase [